MTISEKSSFSESGTAATSTDRSEPPERISAGMRLLILRALSHISGDLVRWIDVAVSRRNL
jgi:hypothetical protein